METLQSTQRAELPQMGRHALFEAAPQDRVRWLINQLSLARIRITPFIARQKVNVLVSERVSGLFLAGEPTLAQQANARGEQVWRVPVDLTLPKRGRVGRVGEVEVDAYYGLVDVNDALLEQMAQRAEQLVGQLHESRVEVERKNKP